MMRLSIGSLVLLLACPAAAQEVAAAPAASFDLAALIADGPPMSAARAATLAVESAPTLERARALRRAAEAGVSRARAAMLPRLELNAGYQHVDGFDDGQISIGADPATLDSLRTLAGMISDPASMMLWQGQIEAQANGSGVSIVIPRNRISFSARLTWPVSDLFFAILPAIDAAQAGSRVREHELALENASVRRNAMEAYYSLVRARGALAVTDEARRQAECGSAPLRR